MTFNGIGYRQAADMLGVEVQFGRKLVRQGRIRAHRVSPNKIRMELAEPEDFVARACTTVRTQR